MSYQIAGFFLIKYIYNNNIIRCKNNDNNHIKDDDYDDEKVF